MSEIHTIAGHVIRWASNHGFGNISKLEKKKKKRKEKEKKKTNRPDSKSAIA